MRVEIQYRWRVKSPAGRWFNTRHTATEESIRKEYPEATPVQGTRPMPNAIATNMGTFPSKNSGLLGASIRWLREANMKSVRRV